MDIEHLVVQRIEIRMLKFTDNPPILAPTMTEIMATDLPWWVGHTKARAEKVMAWDLHNSGVDYFLPLVERVKISGGKRRRLMMPLFAGYIFFRGDAETRYKALTTDHLCTVIPVRDQAELVGELRSLHKALVCKAELELYPFAAVGRRCRVIQGAYMGLEGVVVERKKRARLVLTVGVFGQGASLELDLDAVEPVDDEQSDAGRRPSVVLRR